MNIFQYYSLFSDKLNLHDERKGYIYMLQTWPEKAAI